MIRVNRREAPDGYDSAPPKKAIDAWAAHEEVVIDGYRTAARELYDRQHHKCAYCERLPGWENQPVEHFRPKKGAYDGDPTTGVKDSHDADHYWWLAWSWDNLFFACGRCNGPATKGNWFPLERGTKRLQMPPRRRFRTIPSAHFNVKAERPLLLDPASEDPMFSIVWTPLDETVQDWFALKWLPRHTDLRGKTTIAIFKLDQDHAADVTDDIRTHLIPKAVRIRDAVQIQDKAAVNNAFDELEMLFANTQPFLAARFDAWTWLRRQPLLVQLRTMTRRKVVRPGQR